MCESVSPHVHPVAEAWTGSAVQRPQAMPEERTPLVGTGSVPVKVNLPASPANFFGAALSVPEAGKSVELTDAVGGVRSTRRKHMSVVPLPSVPSLVAANQPYWWPSISGPTLTVAAPYSPFHGVSKYCAEPPLSSSQILNVVLSCSWLGDQVSVFSVMSVFSPTQPGLSHGWTLPAVKQSEEDLGEAKPGDGKVCGHHTVGVMS